MTDRQEAILEYIREHSRVHGVTPTIRQIGDALGISSTSTVSHHLRMIEQAGALTRVERAYESRGLRVPGLHSVMEGDPVTVRDAAGELVTGELVGVGEAA